MFFFASLCGLMMLGSMVDFSDFDEESDDSPEDRGATNEAEFHQDGEIIGSDGNDILSGYDTDDHVVAGAGEDQANGYGGSDLLEGGEGDDRLWGGTGDDTLIGGGGNDSLRGEDGDDLLLGEDGNDDLQGWEGDDKLLGGAGDDTLNGGSGDDSLVGGHGNDALMGGYGNDTLEGGHGSDVLQGGDGNDHLSGIVKDPETGQTIPDERDYLNGGNGDDTVVMGADDWATGGEGADTFIVGDGFSGGPAATIDDYDPSEDGIQVLFDPATNPSPSVSIEHPEDAPDTAHVMVDGELVAYVHGIGAAGLTAADIVLVAQPLANAA